MKVAIIALVLIACVMGAQVRVSKAQQKRVDDLKQTKWGRTLLNFLSLHAQVQGPVQELIDAIQELIEDLNEGLQQLDVDFARRTNEHNSAVIAFEQDIRDAEQDVARMDDVVNNLLLPRRSQIKKNIAQVRDNQDYNRKVLAEEHLVREQEHEAYELQVAEYNEATSAVDEALALLETLTNPSLLQIKKFKNAIGRISKKQWNKVKQGPMVHALVQLALNQNFSDQGIVRQIVDALNEFRGDIINALNELTASEQESQKVFEERCEQLELEYVEFQRQMNQCNIDLAATQSKIEECSDFLNQRETDRKQYVAQLDLEKETYANETDIYQNLKNEYLRELAVSEQAFNLVNNAEFGSSIHLF